MTYRRHRTGRITAILFLLLIIAIIAVCILGVIEYKLSPMVSDAAVSRARTFSTEVINNAVAEAMTDCPPLVNVTAGSEGIASIETDTAALAKLRSDAISCVLRDLSNTELMSFSVPLGNLTGSTVISGLGLPIKIRLVPISDVSADIRTEFIESGINQTLHKIVLRVRVTVNVLVSNETVKLELAADISLAETVIVGKVPDAYTAINRFEIDSDEENDLNDYAATLP